jgi:hypothetical protein
VGLDWQYSTLSSTLKPSRPEATRRPSKGVIQLRVRRAEILRAAVAARQGVMPLAVVVDLLEGGVGGGVGWIEG